MKECYRHFYLSFTGGFYRRILTGGGINKKKYILENVFPIFSKNT